MEFDSPPSPPRRPPGKTVPRRFYFAANSFQPLPYSFIYSLQSQYSFLYCTCSSSWSSDLNTSSHLSIASFYTAFLSREPLTSFSRGKSSREEISIIRVHP